MHNVIIKNFPYHLQGYKYLQIQILIYIFAHACIIPCNNQYSLDKILSTFIHQTCEDIDNGEGSLWSSVNGVMPMPYNVMLNNLISS